MMVDPPAKRRASGLRRVRDQRDLRPQVQNRPASRRMDASGTFLSVRSDKISMLWPVDK
jgi:dual specificity protein kinase YAK1